MVHRRCSINSLPVVYIMSILNRHKNDFIQEAFIQYFSGLIELEEFIEFLKPYETKNRFNIPPDMIQVIVETFNDSVTVKMRHRYNSIGKLNQLNPDVQDMVCLVPIERFDEKILKEIANICRC